MNHLKKKINNSYHFKSRIELNNIVLKLKIYLCMKYIMLLTIILIKIPR